MVRLERRYVRLGEFPPYRLKRRAYVGRVKVPAVAVRDEKADRIARVVWNCKRLDVKMPIALCLALVLAYFWANLASFRALG